MTTDGKLEDLGSELKTVRQVKALSLNAVAKPAKISAAYLQKLEAGVVKNPSPRVLNRIAEVLDLSYSKLMELAGYIMPTLQQTEKHVQNNLVEHALHTEDLSEEERRAVAAFINFLKKQRSRI